MGTGGELLTVHGDDGVVRAVGEVDASTCGQLEAMLSSLDDTVPALVDLSGVTFMDSSGLRILIEHHHRRADDRCGLKLVNPSRAVRRLMDITGLDAVLDIVSE